MTATNINSSAYVARTGMLGIPRRVVFSAAAIGLLAAIAGTAVLVREPAVAAPQVQISRAVRMQIPTMSTGMNQALVLSGQTAQQRNAQIPVAGGQLAEMRGFAEISPSSPQYASALKCLTQAVYYEAANEPELGKRAVAQVVLNRLRHPAFPNTVCGVVYEGANSPVCQFSFTCDGSLLRAPMPRQWAESRRVAEAALAGSVVPEVGSATNYHADYVLPRWAFTLGKLKQIGAHIFYRFPGRVGSAATFTDHWAGFERIPQLDFDRLRRNLAAAEDTAVPEPEASFVPGLTVAPDVKDRHATTDVGGRLNMTTDWRLSIPDPVQLSASYRSAVEEQGAADHQADAVALAHTDADQQLEP
jgi:spore germination cell wall hydrolase CwlJ-like protein